MKHRYSFGAARDLYEKNVHPRVMLGPADLIELRRRIKRGDGKKIMEGLRRKVSLLVSAILQSEDLRVSLVGDGSWNSLGTRVGRAMTDIAMVAALDEDAEVAEAVTRVMNTVLDPGYRSNGPAVSLHSMMMAYDILHHSFDERTRLAYVRQLQKSIHQALRQWSSTYLRCSGANVPLGNVLSNIEAALAIQGDAGASDLSAVLTQLVQSLEATLHTAVTVDGYPMEDIGYGTDVTAWVFLQCEWLRRAGLFDALAEYPRLKRFGQAMLHFVQPWGEDVSNTGDHGDDFGHRQFVLPRLATETGDPTLLWLHGTLHYHHGKVHPENTLPDYYIEVPLRSGFRTPASHLSLLVLDELKGERHPSKTDTETSYRDRGRGIVSFRSSWDKDATFVVFDGSQRSPSVAGHHHASCGHFSMSALGEYFSIDTGRYNNEQSCHSLVLIDGKSGESTEGEWCAVKRHGNLIDYIPGECCDFAAVDSSHQHDCIWARRYIGLVKGGGTPGYLWVVEDINKSDDWSDYWWQLQTSPENTIRTMKKSATIKGCRHGHFLDVHFAIPGPHGYPRPHSLKVEQDLSTTSSYKYIKDIDAHVERYQRPSDMVHGPVYRRPRLLGKVSGYNGRFMSVLIPRQKGSPKLKVRQAKSLDSSFAMKVTHASVEDTIIFAYEHQLLEAEGIEARGQWCVVRRSLKTGRVLAWEMAHGTSLKIDGKRFQV